MSNTINNVTELSPGNPHYCFIGRYHMGDENGNSCVRFAALVLSDEAKKAGYTDVWLDDITTKKFDKESKSELKYQTDPVYVIVRRTHNKDENGPTTYYLAKVIAQKKNADGSFQKHTCIAKEIVTVHSAKESKAGWVTSDSKVMVGRTHNGDENKPTDTTFAKIVIKDESGAEYPLELMYSTDSNMCKESNSDFYYNLYPETNTKFVVWCSKAFGVSFLSHTWVESLNPPEKFCCTGNVEQNIKLDTYDADVNAYKTVNDCRNATLGGITFDLPDAMAVSYGIDGVCHQVANRFLQPINKTMAVISSYPRGYTLSCAMYGTHGHKYDEWYDQIYTASWNKFHDDKLPDRKASATSSLFENEEEADIQRLVDSTHDLFHAHGFEFDKNLLVAEQREWMKQRKAIMLKYGFLTKDSKPQTLPKLTKDQIKEMVDAINEEAAKLQTALREKIGIDNYKKINAGEDVIYQVVDLDTALRFYLGE